ncbi:NAD(P)/FAD-dependent oxidoreductase [Tengunoibacter tsumagoiensis]|uniref:FAD-binding domain-containing protein n=1 Tax=Tengunoibacter tsumagoiensis TaxID=2014871 RepID=A0A402A040_9CHLR|nr:FAD-dependent monooxygenase [Tengunoibacter tsumagoiensis]GCE12508.1 hypothetical protein KTT_23670 [Tengunoibacter tsumagoiensis]
MATASTLSKRNHAIVIGGGIAGLLTARVLLNYFAQVTLIERDHYPEEPIFRPGVPQGRQGHTLLLKGQHIIESLFPGIHEKLIKHGAIEHDYGSQSFFYYGWGRAPRIESSLQGWNSSRLLLEWEIRQALLQYDRLQFLEGHEVIQLLFDQSINQVQGVRVRERNHSNPLENTGKDIKADLVIDASGSTSHAPEWLKELGFQEPAETEINTFLGYATRLYEPPADFQADWNIIAIQGIQNSKRGGVLMTIEGGKWMVILAGTQKDYPPTHNDADFLEFARSLPDPIIYDSIKNATPISSIHGYRRTANRIRHFERLKHFPDRFLVLGDAVCSFNPIYGQGMTVAALEAQVLDKSLKKDQQQKKGFSKHFQRKLARLLISPWLLAAVADAPSMEHPQPILRIPQWYMDRVIMLLPHDAYAFLTFSEVLHMLRSPVALLHPAILTKVLTN